MSNELTQKILSAQASLLSKLACDQQAIDDINLMTGALAVMGKTIEHLSTQLDAVGNLLDHQRLELPKFGKDRIEIKCTGEIKIPHNFTFKISDGVFTPHQILARGLPIPNLTEFSFGLGLTDEQSVVVRAIAKGKAPTTGNKDDYYLMLFEKQSGIRDEIFVPEDFFLSFKFDLIRVCLPEKPVADQSVQSFINELAK